jgi:hypothetical protein
MFIEEDELIKVDTKNSSYMTRVQWKILEQFHLNLYLMLNSIMKV